MGAEREPRLVVVSNRLPLAAKREGDEWFLRHSSGGLVTALEPVLRDRGGLWIGWAGAPLEGLEDVLTTATRGIGYDIRPVEIPEKDREPYYHGFSNEVLWPLFHDFPSFCRFTAKSWAAYRRVNRRFAEAVKSELRPGDFVWVHDYHLMLVGQELRALGVRAPLGFFLHIPFPSPDLFMRLPWRREVLQGLVQYDLLGFQRPRDVRNFVANAAALAKGLTTWFDGSAVTLGLDGRAVRAAPFPASVDTKAIEARAASPGVEEKVRRIRRVPGEIAYVLGVDRADYTKGVPQKLEAFRRFLERHPEHHGRVSLMQILSPSREAIPRYLELRGQVERLVGEINGAFASLGWVPVHYIHRRFDYDELLAWYRVAKVALVTPLKDGMNLVAKEYCACQLDEGDGVLVLSEFAGAASQLREGALVVNPHDVDEVAGALQRALTMPEPEKRRRMRWLRDTIRAHDVHAWVDAFLRAARPAPEPPPAAAAVRSSR